MDGKRVLEIYLDQHLDQATSLHCRSVERDDQLRTIDGLDHVGIGGHRTALVALELTDEMPTQGCMRELVMFGPSLLITVLSDIGDSKLGENRDIGGRERLGNHHELNRPRRSSSREFSRANPSLDISEVGGNLFAPLLFHLVGNRVTRAVPIARDAVSISHDVPPPDPNRLSQHPLNPTTR